MPEKMRFCMKKASSPRMANWLFMEAAGTAHPSFWNRRKPLFFQGFAAPSSSSV